MSYQVTIGIPVYNVENYIRLAMDSALAQTFENIEFLILDDCGTDRSMDIVCEYQQNHPRGKDIRIVRQPQNGGLGRARNRIMDEAKGLYLYHLDGDDAIEPNTIQLLYEQAVTHHADIVYGSYERVYIENGVAVRSEKYLYPYKVFTEPDEYACYAYKRKVQTMTWNFMIRTDILRQNHLREAPVNFGEDFTFTVDLPTYITRAVLLPDLTYHYLVHEINGTRWNTKITRQTMDAYILAIDEKKRRSCLKDKPYYARRCETLLMYDYSFIQQIFNRKEELQPPYTDKEIRDLMWHPMSLSEIMRMPGMRLKNLAAFILGKLPPSLSVFFMKQTLKFIYR